MVMKRPRRVGGGADVVDGAGADLNQPPCGGDGGGLGIEAHQDQRRLHFLQAGSDDGFAAFRWKDAGIALELRNPHADGIAVAVVDFPALFEADAVAQIVGGNVGHQSGRIR
ncbi:hypothetical protein ACMYR2_3460 [Nitrobacter sp. TKz-YC01]